MNRRTFVTTSVVGGIGLLSGCMLDRQYPESSTGSIEGYSLNLVDSEESPRNPELQSREESVVVRGIASVSNGCMSLQFDQDPSVDGDTVVVSLEEYKENNGMCTQAVRDIGYEIVIDKPENITTVQVSVQSVESDSYSLSV